MKQNKGAGMSNSLLKAFSIVDCISENGSPMRLKDICEFLKMKADQTVASFYLFHFADYYF